MLLNARIVLGAVVVFTLLPSFFLFAQKSVSGAGPIISCEPRPALPFYDRLEASWGKRNAKADTSFNWLTGHWQVDAEGFAVKGFRGKKHLKWNDPPREIIREGDGNFFLTYPDSTQIIRTSKDSIKVRFMPQQYLTFDPYTSLWVLKGGYSFG